MQKLATLAFSALILSFAACHGEKPPETTSSGDSNATASSSSSSGTPSETGSSSSSSSGGSASNTSSSSSSGSPSDTATCGGKTCAAGQTCVSYYGIAGPRGPQFHDCVIPCRRGAGSGGCPDGKKCVTIADGPGDVCQ